MFQKIWDNITGKISEHFEKKRQIQEEFETMQRHAEFEDRILMEQQRKRKALEIAKQQAMERAHNETGIRRLRSLNRAQRLEENPNNLFSKLSQHTQKNIQRSMENKKRNELIRAQAKKMREEELKKRQQERMMKINRRKL